MLKLIGSRLEIAFAIFAFSILSGAYVSTPTAMPGGKADFYESNTWAVAANAVLLFLLVIIVFMKRRNIVSLIKAGIIINAFVALAMITILWSAVPMITFRRATLLLGGIMFAYYLVAELPLETVIRRLALALFIAAVASTILALALPEVGAVGLVANPGAWNGVFAHKNGLGLAMVVGISAFGWMLFQEKRYRWKALYALVMAFFVFVTVMAQAVTGVVAEAGLAAASLLLWTLRLSQAIRNWLAFLLLIAVVIGGVLIAGSFGQILSGLGRDPTLTGRVPLWGVLFELASRHLLLGYGYAAFWVSENIDAHQVWQMVGWQMGEAHNGYLEVLLQLGVPGLCLAVWPLFAIIRGSARNYVARVYPWSSFAFTYAIVLAVMSVSEAGLFASSNIHSVLLPACYLALKKYGVAAPASQAARRPLARTKLAFSARDAKPLSEPSRAP